MARDDRDRRNIQRQNPRVRPRRESKKPGLDIDEYKVKKTLSNLKTILYFITGFFLIHKLFSWLSPTSANPGEPEPVGFFDKIFYVIKKLLFIGALVLLIAFAVSSAYDIYFNILGDGVAPTISPVDVVSGAAVQAVNVTQEVAEDTRHTIMEPFWRQECQRRYIQQNPEDMDRKVENCVRQKKGLPPLEDEEDEEWNLRGASNYLDVDVRTEINDGDYLEDNCGDPCGIIETNVENVGDRDIHLEDAELYVEGDRMDGKYPLIFSGQDGKSKEYTLNQFIPFQETIVDGDFVTIDDLETENGRTHLRPNEDYTMNFLVNLTRHMTFSKEDVQEELEGYREQVNERMDPDNETVEEYCEKQNYTIYEGQEVYYEGEELVMDDREGFDSFENYSGQVCQEHVEEAVEGNSDWLMGSETIQPNVDINYTSETESVLNLNVWNTEEWGEMGSDEQDSVTDNHCRTIGRGDSLKQTSDLTHDDVVAFLLYTDCRALSPEDETREVILDVQVQADDTIIEEFGFTGENEVNGFTENGGAGDGICSETIEGSGYPEETFEGGWFTREDGAWDSPSTACFIELPATQTEATLNLGIEAEYTATVSGTGTMDLG